MALATLGKGVERIIASSRSLRLLPLQRETEHGGADDEELAQPTIFPFVIRHQGRVFSLDECRTIHRALSRNANRDGCDQEIAAKICLVGQPVALGEGSPVAALRICAGARLVTEAWSLDEGAAHANIERELGRVATAVSKVEWLLGHTGERPSAVPSLGGPDTTLPGIVANPLVFH